MMNKTIIDFLSLSGSPLLLQRCKEMAKQRFALVEQDEKIRNVTPSQNVVSLSMRENTKIRYFAENLAQVLNCVESENFANRDLYFASLDKALIDADIKIAKGLSFNDCYQHLIANIGIDMLDVLCHGEIESFLELLNTEITVEGNVWTTERCGGFAGYSHCANLFCNGTQAGKVAWGAANFGYYISFSGKGCAAIKMDVLHKALKQMPDVRLTRVDIAFDDLAGRIDVNALRKAYKNGKFITRGAPPKYAYFESGSLVTSSDRKKFGIVPDGGRTFYVGNRKNGKLFRGYEKGKQLQCKDNPNWVRLEVELRNNCRVIPLDVLVNSDPYFTGSYPALTAALQDVPPLIIPISRLVAQASYDRFLTHARKQYGKFINLMSLINDKPEDIIKQLTKGLTEIDIPDRLNIPVCRDNLNQSGELCHV
ncbi:replication initiation factor domain-containing protein [Vibrio scophthalmi]|uniref:replication initiation factor domain-containing protein n=1 Tax=Vibrio scophthalmi TaxID=45658 RepID=UPI0022845CB1|nr:replication initiation factor domain-containing protein [Vibrio scophthalmi]MCY9803351.1 replication initiation factor domain-containing protein [Vibrio scophthalmi]